MMALVLGKSPKGMKTGNTEEANSHKGKETVNLEKVISKAEQLKLQRQNLQGTAALKFKQDQMRNLAEHQRQTESPVLSAGCGSSAGVMWKGPTVLLMTGLWAGPRC